jgi:uncharacterized glyoxalase superfamily protein PhnB
MYKRVTPILIVDAIEPLLPLWDALGFARAAEVPHGDVLGFAMLQSDGVIVMMQTRASMRDDVSATLDGPAPFNAAAIYIDVDDLDAVAAKLPAGTDIVVARRKTFYGAEETWIRDAAGNLIGFAHHAE